MAPSSAGAHLNIPVRLPDGTVVTRQYSLTQRPDVSDFYEIAVLLEDGGRGASQAIHHGWKIGTALRLDRPINQFPLHDDGRPAVLIAGGIGITPILSMAHVLKARGTPFDLHVSAKRPTEMAYRSLLAREYSPQSHFYFSREAGQRRLDIQQVLRDAPADAVFYVCGPQRLIDAVGETARAMGIAAERVQFESFS